MALTKVQTEMAGTGAVLQVVNATFSSNTSTTSTSFVTSGFSVSITPKFATSKILAMVSGGGGYSVATGASLHSTIYRDSTNLGNATYGLTRYYGASSSVLAPHSMTVLDSPATTSAITYTCYFKSLTGASVDFMYSDRGVMSFTLMEIAG